jgi:hypothetical protein
LFESGEKEIDLTQEGIIQYEFMLANFFFGIVLFTLIAAFFWLVVAVFLTDPYSPWTIVQLPYKTDIDASGQIVLREIRTPIFLRDPFSKMTAFLRSGVRIFLYRWIGEPKLGTTASEIIRNIHSRRFDPTKPYVMTGAHYSDLYIRNLGIFYNELLNEEVVLNSEDFLNRQRIALQTLALDLAFLRQNKKFVTTISPMGGATFTGINFYTEPSDSLHAVLLTIKKLRQPGMASERAADALLAEYKDDLQKEVQRYAEFVIDAETLVVKKDIHLASARDGVKRSGAFYDTVIAWRTIQLAQELGILDRNDWPTEFAALLNSVVWKKQIVETYWQEDAGYFANDLDDQRFSADSLIGTSTGFLDPKMAADRRKLEAIADYIQQQKLDSPFPLKYSKKNDQNSLHLLVKLFAPAYMGESIWSHWGVEYIKLLLLLAENTSGQKSCAYLYKAVDGLNAYHQNIETFGGYPELYAGDGSLFQTLAVRGVLHTGWVVNYEAARDHAERLLRNSSCDFSDHLLQY